VLSSEASIVTVGDEVVERRGDPTETALLEAAHRAGFGVEIRDSVPTLASVPFESHLRYSYVVVQEAQPVIRKKGAPERVVSRCTRMRTRDGDVPIDAEAVLRAAGDLASRGLRVLGTAEAALDDGADLREPPTNLVLTGLIGMQDPPRDGVEDAIARCGDAGIRVVMIIGDHAATARAIARQIGIVGDEAAVLTGQDLERLDDEALAEVVRDTRVFARVAPEHKLRVTRALQSHGHVVAVTGDGVNDGQR
jgi:magnesium-transporting ATPase (P-type)